MAELRRWLRRHRSVAAIAVAWLTMVVWFPTLQLPEPAALGLAAEAGRGAAGSGGVTEVSAADSAGATDATAAPTGSGGAAGSGGVQGGAARAGGAGAGVATVPGGAGTAAAGRACRALQGSPPSVYFPTCVPEWSGDNGGVTAPGVTSTKIRIADFWNADPDGGLAPGADAEAYKQARDTFVRHFNEIFQLYGRQVEVVDFYAENDDQHSGACIDAARLADQNVFGVLGGAPNFAKCAAERHRIVSFNSSGDQPESWYAKYHPYIWGHTMDCERTGHGIAEYVGKRVAHRPARWAGDPEMHHQTRRLGLYVPDDEIYGPCVKLAERGLEQEYGAEFVSVFRYSLNKERLADQANRAVVQFKADRVTSVVLAADPVSVGLMTAAATGQQWRPEWVTTGVAGQTFDFYGRLYDQTQVDGHMFGRAAGPEERRYFGSDGEPAEVHRRLTGRELPAQTQGSFYEFLDIFDRIQAAGPRLDAHAIGEGSFSSPEIGSPEAPFGPLSNRTRPDGSPGHDHTRQDGAREVYWDGSAPTYDGQRGAFVSTMEGRFFRPGDWKREDPPVFAGR